MLPISRKARKELPFQKGVFLVDFAALREEKRGIYLILYPERTVCDHFVEA